MHVKIFSERFHAVTLLASSGISAPPARAGIAAAGECWREIWGRAEGLGSPGTDRSGAGKSAQRSPSSSACGSWQLLRARYQGEEDQHLQLCDFRRGQSPCDSPGALRPFELVTDPMRVNVLPFPPEGRADFSSGEKPHNRCGSQQKTPQQLWTAPITAAEESRL